MTGWHWHPEVVLGLEVLLIGYLALTGPIRRRRGWGPPPSSRQVASFLAGLGVMALAVLGPLAERAERTALSAHMVQHLLLLFPVPVLLLRGLPPWLLRPVARGPLGRAGWWLTRAPVAFALAALAQIAWHLPPAFELALRADVAHALEHVSFVGTGLLFWWPVAGTLPEWPRPSPPAQLLYLFLATVPMMAVAAPITLAESLLYPFYARTGAGWPLPPRADQELAGVLMWVGGMLGYLVAGTVVFFQWAGPSAREDGEVPSGTEAQTHGA